MRKLLIRADADAQMGTGHVMRCLALAQAWKDRGGSVEFLSASLDPAIMARLHSEGFSSHRIDESSHRWGDCTADWVVLDGYQFTPDYQRHIKGAGHRLVVIDDMGHLPQYHGDILLNQNLHGQKVNYTCASELRLLLGPKYALLRREFASRKNRVRQVPASGLRVLVTMGGADKANVSLQVLEALTESGLEVVALAGSANPHLESLKSLAAKWSSVRVETNPADVTALMGWADLAVTAGGSTCWELAFMGLPGIVIVLAENQVPVAEAAAEYGFAHNLGHHGNLRSDQISRMVSELAESEVMRRRMSEAGQQLVDGQGAGRVVEALLES